MNSQFYSIPMLVATSIALTTILSETLFAEVDKFWKRSLFWIALYLPHLVASLFLFSYKSVGNLKHSFYMMDQLSHAEECGVDQKFAPSRSGMNAFEEWARHLKSAGTTTSAFSKTSGNECELRLSEEPWLHYRLRRLKRNLSLWIKHGFRDNSLDGGGLASLDAFKKVIELKYIDFKEHWRSLSLGLNGKDNYHYLWIEHSITEETSVFMSMVKDLIVHKDSMPTFRWNTIPEFCQNLAVNPHQTPELEKVYQHIINILSACEERNRIIQDAQSESQMKLHTECNWSALRASLGLGCILRSGISELVYEENMPLDWPGVPRELNLQVNILHVSDAYLKSLQDQGSPLSSYRSLHLSYELSKVLNPRFRYRPTKEEVQDGFDLDSSQIHLISGPDLPLTRLGGLALFSPFGESEIPSVIQSKFQWSDEVNRLSSLKWQFRRSLRGEIRFGDLK